MDATSAVLTETLPDPFSDVRITGDTPKDVLARAIQRDGRTTGVFFDASFALEVADTLIAGWGYDDETQLDAVSLAFDADVQRALAA